MSLRRSCSLRCTADRVKTDAESQWDFVAPVTSKCPNLLMGRFAGEEGNGRLTTRFAAVAHAFDALGGGTGAPDLVGASLHATRGIDRHQEVRLNERSLLYPTPGSSTPFELRCRSGISRSSSLFSKPGDVFVPRRIRNRIASVRALDHRLRAGECPKRLVMLGGNFMPVDEASWPR